jgi:dienelactone hydrolase
VFAAGRGGHANDIPGKLCAPHTLIAAAKEFGKGRVPVTWLVAANDSYFPPAFSRQLIEAFRASSGQVELKTLPASASEGHWMVETESGVKLATAELDRALGLTMGLGGQRPARKQ